MKLKENLIEIDNRLDFFVPLGSSGKSINQNLFFFFIQTFLFIHKTELGLELIEKIHTFTGLNVRAPTGYLGNYRFSKMAYSF